MGRGLTVYFTLINAIQDGCAPEFPELFFLVRTKSNGFNVAPLNFLFPPFLASAGPDHLWT